MIHSISVSGHGIQFIFKICQTVVGLSVTNQFHDFLNLFHGGFFDTWPNCEAAGRAIQARYTAVFEFCPLA